MKVYFSNAGLVMLAEGSTYRIQKEEFAFLSYFADLQSWLENHTEELI
jgi:hypothetical protein